MPIRPENRDRYPADWRNISDGIRFGRANYRCECEGECGRGHVGRCHRRHGDRLTDKARVVLTTAHLDHTPENCDPSNLRAMCQGCHLHYDRDHHARTAAATRQRQRTTGMDTLIERPPMPEPTDPWQRPDYMGDDIYPGFDCWDKKQTGSICFDKTRVPVWAIVADLTSGGWESVADNYDLTDTEGDVTQFLYNLLEARGEFGRLLLTLAAAEAAEGDRRDAVLHEATGGEGGLVNITPGDPEAVQLPPAWWETADLAAPVIDQLRRCLDVLDPDVVLCGCGDGLSAKQGAQCGNCIAADRSGQELRYEAMRDVARRLYNGHRPIYTTTAEGTKNEWRLTVLPNHDQREPMTPDERRALHELEADHG